jgi:hypothetical protein
MTDLSDHNYDLSPDYFIPPAREKAMELRSARQRLNVKRNDLLVSLHVVNSIETELIRAEWMNWLLEESFMCDEVGKALAEEPEEVVNERMHDLVVLGEYCADCRRVWEYTRGRLTEMF